MRYKIRKFQGKYSPEGKLTELIVLYDVNPLQNTFIDIRATKWDLKNNVPGSGYLYLNEEEQNMSNELLQKVAGRCYQISIDEMKKLFSKEVKEIIKLHKEYLIKNPPVEIYEEEAS